MKVHVRTGARIALAGNPSDQYHGKTIAFLIRNFWAEALVQPSDALTIVPNPVHDPVAFQNLEALEAIARRDGYHGGLRLLFATCKRLRQVCAERGIALRKRNFAISYETNIPRQVGLGGSSAIITSAFKALMRFYGVQEQIPLVEWPNIILSVELEELGIAAGLQDRVVQAYGGLVYMDFDRELMERDGHGKYESLDPGLLPPFGLAYESEPSESGRIHSDVRARYLRGDPEVLAARARLVECAERARAALLAHDMRELGAAMDRNFDTRRVLFGEAVLGEANLEMIGIARAAGCAATLTGSGGAVLVLLAGRGNEGELVSEYRRRGYAFVIVRPER